MVSFPDSLRLPFVQLYNLQLPHTTTNFLIVIMVATVVLVTLVMFGCGEHGGQDRTGQNCHFLTF